MTWPWVVLILGGLVLAVLLVLLAIFLVTVLHGIRVDALEKKVATERNRHVMSRLADAARAEREGWPRL